MFIYTQKLYNIEVKLDLSKHLYIYYIHLVEILKSADIIVKLKILVTFIFFNSNND